MRPSNAATGDAASGARHQPRPRRTRLGTRAGGRVIIARPRPAVEARSPPEVSIELGTSDRSEVDCSGAAALRDPSDRGNGEPGASSQAPSLTLPFDVFVPSRRTGARLDRKRRSASAEVAVDAKKADPGL